MTRLVISLCSAIAILVTIAPTRDAKAYPHFIGLGYGSCIVCHFNSLGNGPLTDYGRGVGATGFASKPLFLPEVTDEALSRNSGFLGPVKLPDAIRMGADYRGLYYDAVIGEAQPKNRMIHMRADFELIINYLKYQRGSVIATIGYVPARGDDPNLISREHYITQQINKTWRVNAGFMDHAYGIRHPDHIFSSRRATGNDKNDQTHGVVGHYATQKTDIAVHGFLGNMYQPKRAQLKGLSLFTETEIANKTRLGGSFLFGANKARSRVQGAAHLRFGFGEGNAVLWESGFVRNAEKDSKDTPLAGYAFIQSMARAARGVHILMTGDFYTERFFGPSSRQLSVGPGIQWVPFQRLELRADIMGSRRLGSSDADATGDVFQFLGQVHVWF